MTPLCLLSHSWDYKLNQKRRLKPNLCRFISSFLRWTIVLHTWIKGIGVITWSNCISPCCKVDRTICLSGRPGWCSWLCTAHVIVRNNAETMVQTGLMEPCLAALCLFNITLDWVQLLHMSTGKQPEASWAGALLRATTAWREKSFMGRSVTTWCKHIIDIKDLQIGLCVYEW